MIDCDCRSLTPLILLLFIPIMIIVNDSDNKTQSQVSQPVDYQTPINNSMKYVSSYGWTGFIGFGLLMGIISYKSWQSYHRSLAVMVLLLIPMYYYLFINQIPITSALPFPHLINQTGVMQH